MAEAPDWAKAPAAAPAWASAAPASPKVGMDTGQDTSSKEAFLASGQAPSPKETPADKALSVAKAFSGPAGAAWDILNDEYNIPGLGRDRPLERILSGLPPTSSVVSGGLKRVAAKAAPQEAKAVAQAAPKAEGSAEATVNELQRQRNVAAGVEKPANLSAQGAHETAVLERDKVTTPLRTAAFRDPARVDAAPVEKLIGELEAKNPDPKVRAALKGVRDVIDNATNASKSAGLPAAGARVTPADLKALQGQAKGMNTAMADEVRQSIKRLIEKTGDGALDGHTKQLLAQVRDKLVEGTSPAYKKYLEEYTRLSKPIEEFTAAGNATSKVTTDAAAFHLLNPADKQTMLTAAFKSDTPGRALAELVRDTKHNPAAAQGVRSAYTEWLTGAGDATAAQLSKKWKDTREAVKSSGLMTEEHIANIDKAVTDIADAQHGGSNSIKRGVASVAGFIGGIFVGHPYVGANLARDTMAGASKSQNVEKAVEKAMMAIAADPAGAKLLASPPTPDAVARVRAMLGSVNRSLAESPYVDWSGAQLGAQAAAGANRRPRKDPYSMQPSF